MSKRDFMTAYILARINSDSNLRGVAIVKEAHEAWQALQHYLFNGNT